MNAVGHLFLFAALTLQVGAQPALHLPPLDRVLPPRAEAIYQALAGRVDTRSAVETVAFMSPLWRLAGNPAYDSSLDFIADRLTRGGFPLSSPDTRALPSHHIETFPHSGQGWEQHRGTVSIEGSSASLPSTPLLSAPLRAGRAGRPGPGREVVLSREQDRLALCINSFSTPPGGVVLPLVDVGAGAAADFANVVVAGAVVLGNAPVGSLWARAVREHGAAGVISTDVAAYTRPNVTPAVLQWGSIPYDDTRRSFAFKATPRAARRLREATQAGTVRLHVEVDTTFHRGLNRSLVAEIPGRTRPEERVVLVAHVQEPGANDNASGAGTLLSAALAIGHAVSSGALPPPARTLTFLWLDEIRGSERWIADDPSRVAGVVAMMSLDMTGQDTSKTGGTFLIEKSPDPSAIWPRPSDPHSEWGAGKVDRALVRGHYLNDLHLAVALRRARDTGWVVQTNPYEGGSDHTVFTRAGVPALLNWHFTDRYYHTNLDTIDKTSARTMAHVATVVATTALFVASADASDAAPVTRLLAEAERTRTATERSNRATEEITEAWRRWYAEARASVEKLTR